MPIPQIKTPRFGVCLLVVLVLGLISQPSFAFRWGSWISPSDWHINFGGLQVGTNTRMPEVLTNNGYYPVSISAAALSGGPFTLEGPSLPMTLDPGASVTFNVVFAPTSNDDYSSTLSVVWGRYGRTLNIPVVATGTGTAGLSAVPSALSFGSVAVGSSSTKTATLTAQGASTVISAVNTTNAEFTISGLTLPLSLDAGQAATFTVKFTPQSGGSASGSLAFVSSGSGTVASESVSGAGTVATAHAVDLSWTDGTSDVAGYNVYRATATGGPYGKINDAVNAGANYSDSDVQAGQTYYYVVTAVNGAGAESDYSGEVAARVPTP